MSSFDTRMASAVNHPGTKGWLVAILELGAWAGVLMTGRASGSRDPLDKLSRSRLLCRQAVP